MLWRVGGVIWGSVASLILLVAAVIVTIAVDLPVVGGVAAAFIAGAAIIALAWWLPGVSYRCWTYTVADTNLELRHGIAFRTASVIPYFRVQHVDTSQGPIERRLGLTSLKLHTASAGTDASLPGLSTVEAHALRDTILERAGAGDAV